VYAYFRGSVVPPLNFLYVAAEVLQVDPVWLVLGQGAPLGMPRILPSLGLKYWKTLEEVKARERRQVEEAVAKCLPSFRSMSPRVRDLVYDLFLQIESFNWSYRYCHIPTPESAHDLDSAENLGWILGAALNGLSLDPMWVSKERLEQYVTAMCGLIPMLLPDVGEPSGGELRGIQDLFFRLEKARGDHRPPHLKILGTRHPHQRRLEGNAK
jgi:hypothetical protein